MRRELHKAGDRHQSRMGEVRGTIADHNDIGAFIFRAVKAGRVTPVRAVVVNQNAWVGNSGGQRTARPTTTTCAKAIVICYRLADEWMVRICPPPPAAAGKCEEIFLGTLPRVASVRAGRAFMVQRSEA